MSPVPMSWPTTLVLWATFFAAVFAYNWWVTQ
jgi:hypothetical protein